jgi:hypothetical protein
LIRQTLRQPIGLVDALRKVGDQESSFERRYHLRHHSRALTAEQLVAAVRGHGAWRTHFTGYPTWVAFQYPSY